MNPNPLTPNTMVFLPPTWSYFPNMYPSIDWAQLPFHFPGALEMWKLPVGIHMTLFTFSRDITTGILGIGLFILQIFIRSLLCGWHYGLQEHRAKIYIYMYGHCWHGTCDLIFCLSSERQQTPGMVICFYSTLYKENYKTFTITFNS